MMKKRLLSITAVLFAVLLLCTAMPLPAQALTDGVLVYTVGAGGIATLTRCNATDETYTLPATVGGHPLETLAKGFMSSNTRVKTLIIPDTVKTLQDQCFRDRCPENVIFTGEGVPNLGSMTFYLANGLKTVTLPKNLKALTTAMFRSSTLESVVLPEGLQVISDEAFRECASLGGITIPDSVTTIGARAFYSDVWLMDDVYLGSNVSMIASEAFRNCFRLGKMTIMNGSCQIAGNAFVQCSYPLYIYGRKNSTAYQYCLNDGESSPVFVCATAADHTFPDAWTVALQPTEYYYGLEVRPCALCGITDKRSIPKLAKHDVMALYHDVEAEAWYHDAVSYTVENGLLLGTGNASFSPDTAVSRGMFLTALYRAEGAPQTGTDAFYDVASDAYYAPAVAWAYALGITAGTGDGTCSPDAELTREQAAVFLYRYALVLGKDTAVEGALTAYGDAAQISDFAKSAVTFAVEQRLMGAGGTLAPRSAATRAEAAQLLSSFLQK